MPPTIIRRRVVRPGIRKLRVPAPISAVQQAPALSDEFFYKYGVHIASIAQGANSPGSININAANDFVVRQIAISVVYSTGSAPTGATENEKLYRDAPALATQLTSGHLGMVELLIQTANRPWANIPCPADIFCGDAASPYYLPDPVYLSGNDTINVTAYNKLPTSVGGAASPLINVRLWFIGKMLPRGYVARMLNNA